jgi:hypothetical protein
MTIPGALTTLDEARDYAAHVESLTGEPQLVFHVDPGTVAYACGYRFGTCAQSEREQYEGDGARFVTKETR